MHHPRVVLAQVEAALRLLVARVVVAAWRALVEPRRLRLTNRKRCWQRVLQRLAPFLAAGLKALLASAPLEGIDLTRERDFGRDVEL